MQAEQCGPNPGSLFPWCQRSRRACPRWQMAMHQKRHGAVFRCAFQRQGIEAWTESAERPGSFVYLYRIYRRLDAFSCVFMLGMSCLSRNRGPGCSLVTRRYIQATA